MNMLAVIQPKSDQINSDDLIGTNMTITIVDVQIKGGQEQPVSIYFQESDKAFRPCKSMSRVMVAGWGPDAKKYVGRSLTLYRDPTVKWGGMEVGGIRISHMSHIDKPLVLALTATKGSRKMTTIHPLIMPALTDNGRTKAEAWLTDQLAKIAAAGSFSELTALDKQAAKAVAKLSKEHPDLFEQLHAAIQSRTAALDEPVNPADALVAQFQQAEDQEAYTEGKEAMGLIVESLSEDDLDRVEAAREDAAERILA